MGTMPSPAIRPTVGLRPTMPFTDDGQTMDPLVSVPTAAGAKRTATATAEPELEPQADRPGSCGLRTRPPTALQPLDDWRERKLAHSERFALARTMAPASRSRFTSGASCSRRFAASA